MIDPQEILNAGILIVDDLPANVLLLEEILRNAGYRNITSTMDPAAVRALHRQHRYDLILLDLHMPAVDGFQVMEELKAIEHDGYLSVLVITAQPDHKLRALAAGAKDFIGKPFDLIEVQTRIRNMLEVRLLYRRLREHNALLERIVQQRTAALSESEARFRSFARLSADWFWEQDSEGRIVVDSGLALEMLGLDPADADGGTGLHSVDDTPVHLAESLARSPAAPRWNLRQREVLMANIAARRPFIDHLYSRTFADGQVQYLQVSGEPIFDSSNRYTGFRGVGADVTSRMLHDHRPN
jgi:PAS domain S-box-containing protein